MNTKILLILTIGLCYAPSSESKVGKGSASTYLTPTTAMHLKEYMQDNETIKHFETATANVSEGAPRYDAIYALIDAIRASHDEKDLESPKNRYYSRSGTLPKEKIEKIGEIIIENAIEVNKQFPLEGGDGILQEAVKALKRIWSLDRMKIIKQTSQWRKIYPLAPILPLALYETNRQVKDTNYPLRSLNFSAVQLIQIGQIVANLKSNISPDNRTIFSIGEEALNKALQEILGMSNMIGKEDWPEAYNYYISIAKAAHQLGIEELALTALEKAKSIVKTDSEGEIVKELEQKLNQTSAAEA